MVFPQAHIVTETHNAIHIEFGELFDSVWISELVDYWLIYACFHEGDEECHYDSKGIRGKLKGSYVKVSKHSLDKGMERKRSSSSHDLVEVHMP